MSDVQAATDHRLDVHQPRAVLVWASFVLAVVAMVTLAWVSVVTLRQQSQIDAESQRWRQGIFQQCQVRNAQVAAVIAETRSLYLGIAAVTTNPATARQLTASADHLGRLEIPKCVRPPGGHP